MCHAGYLIYFVMFIFYILVYQELSVLDTHPPYVT